MKSLFSALLLLCFTTISFAQKATVKDDVVYRDGAAYCRIIRLNTSTFSPRFSFQTLDGKEFAVAQNKPSVGYVFYFTTLDTLVSISPAIPYAESLAQMVVQHDLLASGLPDEKALRRFALLEGRNGSSTLNKTLKDMGDGIDRLFEGKKVDTSGGAEK